MEINASLAVLELHSRNPEALAQFYASTFCLTTTHSEDAIVCKADGRELRIVAGPAGQLLRASYRSHSAADFRSHKAFLVARHIELFEDESDRYTVVDPDGHLITFLGPLTGDTGASASVALGARLQHFALRSPTPSKLVDFYVGSLGFVMSDRVFDADGDLTAAFMRTDSEHHSLAIFRAPEARFDHFSCEAPDWVRLRDWADHMASTGTDLAWGIGRHGPGNDTFLMVRDLDGNMGEISAELEVCAPGRPVGVWPHRPQTLNQWGVAIMRS